ncbi:hypothetical protein SS50377_22635 [Spironucleus salmonicida]|uniref:Uncharacterized protein n=1 Tax=Spironucleus salmonicida TaxID=348837 RepID=V6LQ46_9EUKA|nr:hypothetical protein SS50377_22635 [Spironucleus salmonicida]|eukprot:EST46700.1 Hypothetical protein SS50377_13294 [Spironucleus salmonicida]
MKVHQGILGVVKSQKKYDINQKLPQILISKESSYDYSDDEQGRNIDFQLFQQTLNTYCETRSSDKKLSQSNVSAIPATVLLTFDKTFEPQSSDQIQQQLPVKERLILCDSDQNQSNNCKITKLLQAPSFTERKSSIRKSKTIDRQRQSSEFTVAPFALAMSQKCKIKSSIEELNYEEERLEYISQLIDDHLENIAILQQNEMFIKQFLVDQENNNQM